MLVMGEYQLNENGFSSETMDETAYWKKKKLSTTFRKNIFPECEGGINTFSDE